MTTQDTCRCHEPRTFGHRSDCPYGHRFLPDLPPDAKPGYVAARAESADRYQAMFDAPLRLESRPMSRKRR
jgi:hypothetical protein